LGVLVSLTQAKEEADQEFENSSKLTTALTNAIIDQSTTTVKNDNEMRKVVSKENAIRQKNKQKLIEENLTTDKKKLHQLNRH